MPGVASFCAALSCRWHLWMEVAKLSPNMFLEICNIVVFIFVVTAFCYVSVQGRGPRALCPSSSHLDTLVKRTFADGKPTDRVVKNELNNTNKILPRMQQSPDDTSAWLPTEFVRTNADAAEHRIQTIAA